MTGDAVPVPGDMPVYDDAAASMKSLKRLRGIAGIRVLLSAWDEPRRGDAAYFQMDKALDYLRNIHETVLAFSRDGVTNPEELTKRTAQALGLPPESVNPLLSRTFAANLSPSDQKNQFSFSKEDSS